MEDGTVIYEGELGRIVAYPSEGVCDAWDGNGEYLGGFSSPTYALAAMNEAYAAHYNLTGI